MAAFAGSAAIPAVIVKHNSQAKIFLPNFFINILLKKEIKIKKTHSRSHAPKNTKLRFEPNNN